jgi:hypothetical protein
LRPSAGLSYELIVSLQNHPSNPNQVSIENKSFHLDGNKVGTVKEYLTETGIYVLESFDGNLSEIKGINEADRFELFDAFNEPQDVLDSYELVLSTEPDVDVVIEIDPQRTRTYNSDVAFDADKFFGENNEKQVQVATNIAKINVFDDGASSLKLIIEPVGGGKVVFEADNITTLESLVETDKIVPSTSYIEYEGDAQKLIVEAVGGGKVGFEAANRYDRNALESFVETARYEGSYVTSDKHLIIESKNGHAFYATLSSESTSSHVHEIEFGGQALVGQTWSLEVGGRTMEYQIVNSSAFSGDADQWVKSSTKDVKICIRSQDVLERFRYTGEPWFTETHCIINILSTTLHPLVRVPAER